MAFEKIFRLWSYFGLFNVHWVEITYIWVKITCFWHCNSFHSKFGKFNQCVVWILLTILLVICFFNQLIFNYFFQWVACTSLLVVIVSTLVFIISTMPAMQDEDEYIGQLLSNNFEKKNRKEQTFFLLILPSINAKYYRKIFQNRKCFVQNSGFKSPPGKGIIFWTFFFWFFKFFVTNGDLKPGFWTKHVLLFR